MGQIDDIFIYCNLIAVASAISAAISRDIRQAALSLWICGLAVGGCFLCFNAEFLAIVQWIVSTLVASAFIFYSVLLGNRDPKPELIIYGMAGFLGGVFVYLNYIIVRDFGPISISGSRPNLAEIGSVLISQHLLPLEMVSLLLFLVIIGAGALSRPEMKK